MKKILCVALTLLLLLPFATVVTIAEEKPVLHVLTEYVTTDLNTDSSAIATEQLTGYKVEYSSLPSENTLAKLNAMMAAREDIDVIILAYSHFVDTVSMGAYLPLTELLKEHAPEILKGTEESLWTNTTIDGEIMGIPYRKSTENYNSGIRIRTDLLKKVGIETIPNTLSGFYDMLVAIRDKLGIIPLTGYGAIVAEIASAFSIPNVWNVTGEGIRNRASMASTKDYVAFMNKLYTEGLLDDELPVNTSASAREKFLSGRAAMNRVYWWEEPSTTETLLANFPEVAFDYLPPLNGEYEANITINRGSDMVVVIPRYSPNAEHALKWINSKVTDPAIFRELCIGTEGVSYLINEAGEYVPIQPAFSQMRQNADIFLTGTITADYNKYWTQTRVRKNDLLYKEFVHMQENIEGVRVVYDVTTFMSPNTEFSKLASSVNTYVNDTILQMIVGTRPITEWDDFVQEYYDAGGETLEQILNDWWSKSAERIEPMLSHD